MSSGFTPTAPQGKQTGYVQVDYTLKGTPGTLAPLPDFVPVDVAWVAGFDTSSLLFAYKRCVPDTAVAKYTIYADTGHRPSGNHADFLTGIGPNGQTFTLGPGQLSSAEVRGSLISPVPLPPTVWGAAAMLLALGSATAVGKSFATSRNA